MLLFILEHIAEFFHVSLFQYISCYSLSRGVMRLSRLLQCFNTSHVTLYPFADGTDAEITKSFNTSHVTLYRKWQNKEPSRNYVSIHLMLLFIRQSGKQINELFSVSIHLMLLFICVSCPICFL